MVYLDEDTGFLAWMDKEWVEEAVANLDQMEG